MIRFFRALAFIVAILLCWNLSFADPINQGDKNEVLARIVLELPRYVYFRDANNTSMLCIAGNPELYEHLVKLNTKVQSYSSIIEAGKQSCRYNYVEKKQEARRLLRSSTIAGKLFISNYSSFVDEGGAIAIIDNNGRLEINLNLTAVKRLNGKFSPDLIELSKKVIQ